MCNVNYIFYSNYHNFSIISYKYNFYLILGKVSLVFILFSENLQKKFDRKMNFSVFPFKIYDKLVYFFLTDFYFYPCKIYKNLHFFSILISPLQHIYIPIISKNFNFFLNFYMNLIYIYGILGNFKIYSLFINRF